jgi:hypothetical protein
VLSTPSLLLVPFQDHRHTHRFRYHIAIARGTWPSPPHTARSHELAALRAGTSSYVICLPDSLPIGHTAKTCMTDFLRTQLAGQDADNDALTQPSVAIPSSPPPSFRSHPSSRRHSRDDARSNEADRDLDNAFDAPSDDEDDDDDTRDRRRLIATSEETPNYDGAQSSSTTRPDAPPRSVTQLPSFPTTPAGGSGRIVGSSQANDGVFANISAKPRAGEDLEEKPPVSIRCATHMTVPVLMRQLDLRGSLRRCNTTLLGNAHSIPIRHERQSRRCLR